MWSHLAHMGNSYFPLLAQWLWNGKPQAGHADLRTFLQRLRQAGWLRQARIYQMRRFRHRWSAVPWLRHPPGRWPALQTSILALCNDFSSSETSPHTCFFPPHTLAVLCTQSQNPPLAALFLYDLALPRSLPIHEALTAITPILAAVLKDSYPLQADLNPLDSRIAKALVEGLTTREIAARLHLAESTVRSRIARLIRHYGVKRRTALVAKLAQELPYRRQEQRISEEKANYGPSEPLTGCKKKVVNIQ